MFLRLLSFNNKIILSFFSVTKVGVSSRILLFLKLSYGFITFSLFSRVIYNLCMEVVMWINSSISKKKKKNAWRCSETVGCTELTHLRKTSGWQPRIAAGQAIRNIIQSSYNIFPDIFLQELRNSTWMARPQLNSLKRCVEEFLVLCLLFRKVPNTVQEKIRKNSHRKIDIRHLSGQITLLICLEARYLSPLLCRWLTILQWCPKKISALYHPLSRLLVRKLITGKEMRSPNEDYY